MIIAHIVINPSPYDPNFNGSITPAIIDIAGKTFVLVVVH